MNSPTRPTLSRAESFLPPPPSLRTAACNTRGGRQTGELQPYFSLGVCAGVLQRLPACLPASFSLSSHSCILIPSWPAYKRQVEAQVGC